MGKKYTPEEKQKAWKEAKNTLDKFGTLPKKRGDTSRKTKTKLPKED